MSKQKKSLMPLFDLHCILRLLGLLVFFTVSNSVFSQIPSNEIGRNPHNLKWKQIDTEKVQVVFPEGQEMDAKRVADIVSYLWDYDGQDIGQLRSKISIFLHGHRVSSNGLVTVGPFRSEFYQTSPQMANSTRYLDLLTIHEYRHGQQFANATQGITKVVKSALGSFAWGGMMALALPRWYFEGDAVVGETEHSATGRGRLPSFLMQYDALVAAGKNYNYEKAAAGSYQDYVPSWYPLGYHILSYGKENFGDDLWIDVAEDAVRYKGFFTPFSRSLKKRTGLNSTNLYNETYADIKRKFNEKRGPWKSYTPFLEEKESSVVNYSSPVFLGNSIITSRAAYNEIPAYYIISEKGRKKKLVEHGRLTDAPYGTLSSDGRKIYWAELAFNARWNNRQYSVIYEYDLLTNKKKQLTKKSRYFAPAVNADVSKVVAVHVSESQEHKIAIIDLASPTNVEIVPINEQYAISQPTWFDSGNVTAVFSKNEKSFIAIVDVVSGELNKLTPVLSYQLSHPVVGDGRIFFSAAYSGVNNIYAVNIKDGTLFQVTQSRIGAFHPNLSKNGKRLTFTEFSADGFKVKTQALNPSEFLVYLPQSQFEIEKSKHSDDDSILDEVPSGDYKIEKFGHLNGLLNPHSFLADIDDVSAELSIRSDNKFSTMSIDAGARFNFNEDRWSYGVNMNYAEFYPILHVGVNRSYRSAEHLNFQELNDTSLVFSNYVGEWAENSVNVGITIPYNFSKGNMNNIIRLRTDYARTNIDLFRDINDSQGFRDTLVGEGVNERFEDLLGEPLQEGSFSTIDTRVSFQMLKNRARQHLSSRLGVAVFGRFRNNLNDKRFGGDVWSYGGSLFLPGIGKNHSFSIDAFFQHESVVSPYRYGDANSYPRGYNVSFRRDDFGKIGLNYSFPIAYPDLALGGLAFIKRIKGKAFYDHGWLKYTSFPGDNTKQDLRSLGFELGMDFRALRLVEVDLGFRYSYLLDNSVLGSNRGPHQFDFFVLSIREQ